MYKDLLYRNNGDGTFTKIADSPVVNDATWSGGSAWGDFDNDADLDLFVGMYDGHNRLYENDGTGTFTSIDTGVVVTDGSYIMGVAWADYDRDGDLDLFTARNNYFGGNNCLYRNDAADQTQTEFATKARNRMKRTRNRGTHPQVSHIRVPDNLCNLRNLRMDSVSGSCPSRLNAGSGDLPRA